MTPEDIENARGAIRAVRESATGRGILGPAALQCAAWLERALAEIERLRADAARLDHIEKHARYDPKIDGNHAWWPTTFENVLRGPTLRAAIDAAMKEESGEQSTSSFENFMEIPYGAR